MEHGGSPVIDVDGATATGDATEVVWPDERAVRLSLGESSDSGHESPTDSQEEESGAVDPSEESRSYVFGPSTVMVSRIREMPSLHYFVEGDVLVPREEVVPESTDDEAAVFEEFFMTGLRITPRPTLTDILQKFRVQLHQLIATPPHNCQRIFVRCLAPAAFQQATASPSATKCIISRRRLM
jgi:hypothetical protein